MPLWVWLSDRRDEPITWLSLKVKDDYAESMNAENNKAASGLRPPFLGYFRQAYPLVEGKLQLPAVLERETIEGCIRALAYPKFKLVESEIEFLISQEIVHWFEIVTVSPGKPYVTADPRMTSLSGAPWKGERMLLFRVMNTF